MQNQVHRVDPVKSIAKTFLAGALLLLVACTHKSPAERYGFLTLLGRDTISLESITRDDNTLTSDEVDRFPRVRVRHTVIKLAPGDRIEHLVMDIHTPSESPKQRECKVIADVTADSVLISKTDGAGTLHRAFATNGGIAMAHVPQMYSLYELYFSAALKHAAALKVKPDSTIQMRQFYIDREFDHFPLHTGEVTPVGNGKVDISHDWLSGTGEATIDSNYHMLSYSGARTTYKVQVTRLANPPDIQGIASRFEGVEANAGKVKQLSVRDTMQAEIGNAKFTVDYGRPLARGRKLLGDVLPYDYVWRTGANAATQFITSQPITLAGMKVPAGRYTLWTVPRTNGVELIVNKQTGQWGTEYDSSQDLGMAKMKSDSLLVPVEEFTISIVPADAHHGSLTMEWGSFKWTAPIGVQ